MKYVGLDQVVEKVARKLGDVLMVFLTGDFARGKDSSIVDLIFVGDHIDKEYLIRLVEKAEQLIRRKIRYLVYTVAEFQSEYPARRIDDDLLLLWKA
jgi:predicted nucleotidyltransferase